MEALTRRQRRGGNSFKFKIYPCFDWISNFSRLSSLSLSRLLFAADLGCVVTHTILIAVTSHSKLFTLHYMWRFLMIFQRLYQRDTEREKWGEGEGGKGITMMKMKMENENLMWTRDVTQKKKVIWFQLEMRMNEIVICVPLTDFGSLKQHISPSLPPTHLNQSAFHHFMCKYS